MTGFLSFVIGDKKMKITGNFVALLCNVNFHWVKGKSPLLQRCVLLQVKMPGVDATLWTT